MTALPLEARVVAAGLTSELNSRAVPTRLEGPLASIFGSLQDLPPGSNPFAYLLQQLRATTAFIPATGAFKNNIIAIGVLILIAAVLNLLALAVPLFRGREARAMHFWLARLKHTRNYRHPYILPNGRLFASIFSLAACGFLLAQIIILLWAPVKISAGLFTISCIPFFFVSYLALFDAVFAVWVLPASSHRSRLDAFKSPWLLNSLCWVVPLIVLVVEVVVNARLWVISDTTVVDSTMMSELLQQAATAYDAGGLRAVNTTGLLTESRTITDHYMLYVARQADVALSWMVFFSFSVALFCGALFLLVRTVWPYLELPRPKLGSGEKTVRVRRESTIGVASVAIPVTRHQTRSSRTAYRLLIAYFFALAALSAWALGALSYLYVSGDQIAFDTGVYHRSVIATYYPVAFMLVMIGGLSLSRVVGRRIDSGPPTPTLAAASRGPHRVGLFDTRQDNEKDGLPTSSRRPWATPVDALQPAGNVFQVSMVARQELLDSEKPPLHSPEAENV